MPKKVISKPVKVTIHKLPTGVRGLDDILGGGISEFSFNIICGTPGCGKTTLAHQIAFANGTPKNPALYFSVLGEPVLKMLRYQQQFSFFDESKLGNAVRFINLSNIALEKDLNAVLEEIYQAGQGGQRRSRGDRFLSHSRSEGDQRRWRGRSPGPSFIASHSS